jgi:hypothetical protein
MTVAEEETLSSRLADPARPVFLLGEVPPGEGTSPGKCLDIASKFAARSRALATDGFIVYDIQDEPGRSDMERPFPFRRVMDSSAFASLLAKTSNKPCCVYKCVADAEFEAWIDRAVTEHGHSAINLVGRATSEGEYVGPPISEAMKLVKDKKNLHFGCVCIAERHTFEAAKSRGKGKHSDPSLSIPTVIVYLIIFSYFFSRLSYRTLEHVAQTKSRCGLVH